MTPQRHEVWHELCLPSSLPTPAAPQAVCASSPTGAAAVPALELAALLSTQAYQSREFLRVVFNRQDTDQGVFHFHPQPFTMGEITHLRASR